MLEASCQGSFFSANVSTTTTAADVGKDCVRREVIAEEYVKPLCCGVEQTHG